MAELNTKQELIDRQLPENFQKEIAKARASEREKVQKEGFEKGGWVQIDSKAFLIMMEKKEAEIRASALQEVQDMIAKEAKDTVWLTDGCTVHDAIDGMKKKKED